MVGPVGEDDARPIPWKPIAVAIVVALGLTIAPWTIRNYHASHHFVLV